MNKYEKWIASFDKSVNTRVNTNIRGGWDTPVCCACAIRMLEELGRCNHMDYIRDEFVFEYRSFTSFDGRALRGHMDDDYMCGCP